MLFHKRKIWFCCWALLLLFSSSAYTQQVGSIKIIPVGNGWASNSVNTVIFRKNSLCTFKGTQYISYYSEAGFVVLGKRKLASSKWELRTTTLKGDVTDAHRSISIMTDGDGYLHIAWNHHNNALHYCKNVAPGSLELTAEMPMTGSLEKSLTYPEFHYLPNGNLLFLYRDGQSGQGNLVINYYTTKTKQWKQLHANLVDGEKQRNAYWQAFADARGVVHLSWVWRESPDVASNHDICYARSLDGGITWENSKGDKYNLPITAATAEYVCRIPQKSELINQTSMYADENSNPVIATYWREGNETVPQYHIVFNFGRQWLVQNLGFRKTAFSLSGAGTKRVPISRPQVISWQEKGKTVVAVIFRDEELGNKVSLAFKKNLKTPVWTVKNITDENVGSWEPSYDTELWKSKKQLNLFVQNTVQIDGEGKAAIAAQPIKVLSFKIK